MKIEMPKFVNWFSLLLLTVSLFTFTACGEGKADDGADSGNTFVDDTVSTDEVEEPAEDKQKRPSPPAEASATIGSATVRIDYSMPSVKGRTIWGELVPYGSVWRTGANEATVFEVDKAVTINGKTLPAGKYGLFSIPAEGGKWTIIFNSIWDQWGAYNYDESKDALRVEATTANLDEVVEKLTFAIADGGQVTLSWGKLAASFTVAAE